MLSNPHLLPEDVSKGAAHHENHKKKEHQHVVTEQRGDDQTCPFNDMEVDDDDGVSYVSRKHLISFMAAKHPKKERRIMAVEEMRMM